MERYEILVSLSNIEDMTNMQIAANTTFIRDIAKAAYDYIKLMPSQERETWAAGEGQQGG